MDLKKIFKDIEYKELNKGNEFFLSGIEYDSRKIKDNNIFVAMKGSLTNGHDYIEKAILNGAKAIILEEEVEIYNKYKEISFYLVKNLRKKLGIITSNIYDWPQNKLKVIGITGTNGKTTSSYILSHLLPNSSRIGTTGYKILNEEIEAVNTTPESMDIIKLMNMSCEKNVTHFIMEVSSHALSIGRVDMLKFDSAIFTNLTQDHLDFHETMENYFLAKSKIFDLLKDDAKVLVNEDDDYGRKLINKYDKTIKYSVKNKNSDLYGEILKYTHEGMQVLVKYKEESLIFDTKLVGEYNLQNILASIGVLLSFGEKFTDVVEKIKDLPPVPGRFELIENNKKAMVVVDFAHTPDGLYNVLTTLKDITKSRVITLFGAGGDRDNKKRPLMAKAAAEFSDYIIITSDNPRTENAKDILDQVEKGLEEVNFDKNNYIKIENREEAIKYGISMLKANDSLLIAGKGHETYQIIGKIKHHFDDREIASKHLKNI